jgi:hypothetical protein
MITGPIRVFLDIDGVLRGDDFLNGKRKRKGDSIAMTGQLATTGFFPPLHLDYLHNDNSYSHVVTGISALQTA